jgi:GldM C-terminal domain
MQSITQPFFIPMLQKILLYLLPFYAWYVYGKVCPSYPNKPMYEKIIAQQNRLISNNLNAYFEPYGGNIYATSRLIIPSLVLQKSIDSVCAPFLSYLDATILDLETKSLNKAARLQIFETIRQTYPNNFLSVFDSFEVFYRKYSAFGQNNYPTDYDKRFDKKYIQELKRLISNDEFIDQNMQETYVADAEKMLFFLKIIQYLAIQNKYTIYNLALETFAKRYNDFGFYYFSPLILQDTQTSSNYVELGQDYTTKIVLGTNLNVERNCVSLEINGQAQPIGDANDIIFQTKNDTAGVHTVPVKAGMINYHTGDTMYHTRYFKYVVLPPKIVSLAYKPIKTQALAYLPTGGMGGKISRENLLKNTHIHLKSNDLEDSTCACKILNFELIYTPLRENPIVYKNAGGEFSEAIQQQFSKAQKGDIFNIERIKLACKELKNTANVNYLSFIID